MKIFQNLYILSLLFITFSGCSTSTPANTSQNYPTQTLTVKYEVIASDLYRLSYTNATGSDNTFLDQSGNFGLQFQLTASVNNKKSVSLSAHANSSNSIITARIYVNGVVFKEATGNLVVCNGVLPQN